MARNLLEKAIDDIVRVKNQTLAKIASNEGINRGADRVQEWKANTRYRAQTRPVSNAFLFSPQVLRKGVQSAKDLSSYYKAVANTPDSPGRLDDVMRLPANTLSSFTGLAQYPINWAASGSQNIDMGVDEIRQGNIDSGVGKTIVGAGQFLGGSGGAYLMATAPFKGGPKGIGTRAVAGAGLGTGMGTGAKAITGTYNRLTGGENTDILPTRQELGEFAQSGVENSWMLAITNTVTDNALKAFGANKLVGDAITEPFKQGAVKEGWRRVLTRALAEVPAENTAFTFLDELKGKNKEEFVTQWMLNLPGNIATNLAFGVAQGTWNTAKNTEAQKAIVDALQETVRQWTRPVATMEANKDGSRRTIPYWRYKLETDNPLKKIGLQAEPLEVMKSMENAINEGDKTKALKIFNQMPDNDPYKESMRGLFERKGWLDTQPPLYDTFKNKEFTFVRNSEKSVNMGSRFGQDIEPAGKYMNLADEGQKYFPPGWETGKVKFKNPLVIDWGGDYQSGKNWKNVLSQKYDGKTGKELSQAIAKDGYDGIITLDGGKPSEVVSLKDFNDAQGDLGEAGTKKAIADENQRGGIDTEWLMKKLGIDPEGRIKASDEVKANKPEDVTADADFKTTQAIIKEDEGTAENIIRQWLGGKYVAKTEGGAIGYKYEQQLKGIPETKEGFMEFMNHVQGVEKSSDPNIVKAAEEWSKDTDALYKVINEQAQRLGIKDLGYVEDYATQIWKQDDEVVAKALQRLSKSNPSFNARSFESYKQGMEYGLEPKYTNPARVIAEYTKRLYITKNNLDLFETLKNDGLLVEGSIGRKTPGFEPINAPGFPRSTSYFEGKEVDAPYYSPDSVAKTINQLFSEKNYSTKLQYLADASRRFQNVSLSGGTPVAPGNAFFSAQLQKEMLSGNIKDPIGVFATASVPSARKRYMVDNLDVIKEMQTKGVLQSIGLEPEMLDKPSGAGEVFDRVMADPTFKWGMPMLQIENYKKIKANAIESGLDDARASDVAADAVNKFYGLMDPMKQATQSKDIENLKSIFLFAPYYREAMINFWKNNIKALKNPLAPENRTNIKFIAGASIMYGLMNATNQMLNGHPMSENPEYKKDKLLIPAGDKTVGVPFLSSIATVPRGAIRITSNVLQGDIKDAAADTFQTFASMALKPIGDLAKNSDYFGREIYDEDAPPSQKREEQAKYLAKQATVHPWVKALISTYEDGVPDNPLEWFEKISTASELPFRFYDTDSILNSPFWDRINEAEEINERYKELQHDNPDRAAQYYLENQELIDELPQMRFVKGKFFDKENPDPTALLDYMGVEQPTYEQSDDAPQNGISRASLYAQSAIANPLQTFQAISNDEPIRKLRTRGDGIMGFFDSSTVTERRTDISGLDYGDTETQVDHTVPKWAGGRETEDNYQVLTNEEHKAKSELETSLRNQYEAGDLTRNQVLNQLDEFNKTLNPVDVKQEGSIAHFSENKLKYFDSDSGQARSYTLPDMEKTLTSRYQQAKRRDEAFSVARKIYSNPDIDENIKTLAFGKLGIEQEDLEYYDVASEYNDIKTTYVTEQLDQLLNESPDRTQMLQYLVNGRREVQGKMIVANGVLDNLVDLGYITKAEAKEIKDFSFDENGQPKVKVSGRGRSAKLKKINIEAPKVRQLSTRLDVPNIKGVSLSPGSVPQGFGITPITSPEIPIKFNL